MRTSIVPAIAISINGALKIPNIAPAKPTSDSMFLPRKRYKRPSNTEFVDINEHQSSVSSSLAPIILMTSFGGSVATNAQAVVSFWPVSPFILPQSVSLSGGEHNQAQYWIIPATAATVTPYNVVTTSV